MVRLRRLRLTLICALLLGCICLACRPVSGPPWQQSAATPEPVEITLVNPYAGTGDDPRIQDFMDQYPDITVLSYPMRGWGRGGDLVRRIREAAEETGEDRGAPDIIHTQADFLASLGEEGLLLNLSPFMHEVGDLTPEAFFPELIEPMLVGDQVFVLPVSVDPVMLFYNADMFAQKGVAPPTAEWTWDYLLEAAVRLAEPNAIPPVHGLAVMEVLPFIYQNGGSLVDDPLVPTRFTLDSPDTVDAMQWVMDLEEFYSVSPPFAELQRHEGRAFEMVLEGRVAMWVSSMSFRNYVSSETVWPFQWGVAPLPGGRTSATVGSMEGVAILKNAPNPRACWELARYLVTHLPPGVGPLSQLPALRSAAESQEFLNRMPEKNVESYEQSLPFLMPTLKLPAGVEWQLYGILERSLNPAFTGEVTIQDALEEAQEEADRLLTPQLME
jgi:multiple sugar transport system substrate-binding protein